MTKGAGTGYYTSPSYSYDPSTGIYTYRFGGGWCYWDDPYISANGAAEVWLIY